MKEGWVSIGVVFDMLAFLGFAIDKRDINRYEKKIKLINNRVEGNKRKVCLHKKAILALDNNFTKTTQQVVNLQQCHEELYDKITVNDIKNIKIKKRTRTLK